MLGWSDLDEYVTVAGAARLIRQAVRAYTVCCFLSVVGRVTLLC